jgi:mono/diheme cytochrome c family protein
MIDHGFSDENAIALAVYLKSLTRVESGLPRVGGSRDEPQLFLERGRRVYELYCSACHGPEGTGGVENPNCVNEVIPELDLIAERMFLFERPDGDEFLAAVEKYGDLNRADPAPDLPRYPVVLAQYNAIRQVILNGNPSSKADPEGPAPFNMPSWRKSLTEDEVDSLIAYLVSIYEFEEYE